MNLADKLVIINELLKHLKTNTRETSNLEAIGLSSNSGNLSIGKVLKPGMKLYYESVTGRYKTLVFEVPNGI